MIWSQLVGCGYLLVISSSVLWIWISLCRQNKTSSFGNREPHYSPFTFTFWQINQQWTLVVSCSPNSRCCSFLPLCLWRWRRWRCTLSWRPGCRTSSEAWSCCRRRYQTLNHNYWWLISYPLTFTKALQTDVFWPNIMRILSSTNRETHLHPNQTGGPRDACRPRRW